MKHYRVSLFLLVAALSSAGCGSPNKTAKQPSPTATAAGSATSASNSTLPADLNAFLNQYALTAADLPPGYAVAGQVELANEQATSGYADPQAVAKEIHDTGRQGGIAQQVLSPTADAGQIGLTIESFKDADGAKQWVNKLPTPPSSLKSTPANLPQQLGEQSNATHWTQGDTAGYVVNFRRGRLVFGLGISAPNGKESLEPLIALAKKLDDKAKRQAS
ncbi:MAG: hypothetical protein ACR2PL_07860 [Dehalococcoidia bacterium]